jgi:uncharacterized protein
MNDHIFLLLLLFSALLYTSVGHGGASGYLAIMAIFQVTPEIMRPSALVLNIVASVPTLWQFYSAGHFDRRMFFWLAAGSIPFTFFASSFTLPYPIFRLLIASVLLIAAFRLLWSKLPNQSPNQSPNQPHSNNEPKPSPLKTMPNYLGVLIGAPIGILAGLTGIGGGVYLTPILLFAGWCEPKKAAGISSAFILVNSLAGLIGQWNKVVKLPPEVPVCAFVVLIGGIVGSSLGSRFLNAIWLRRLLAVVLIFAVFKLILG